MLSSFGDEIDKSGTAVPSFSAPAAEKELVVAAKNGNEEAFEILVERYRARSPQGTHDDKEEYLWQAISQRGLRRLRLLP